MDAGTNWNAKKLPIFEEGEYIDHFRIQQHIGSGGFGQLYVVADVETDELWAMKVENTENDPEGEEDKEQGAAKNHDAEEGDNADGEAGGEQEAEDGEGRRGNTLETEVDFLKKCAKRYKTERWYPRIRKEDSLRKCWEGIQRPIRYMIQELLGPSVNDLYKTLAQVQNRNSKQSETSYKDRDAIEKSIIIHTTLRIAKRMLECIRKFSDVEGWVETQKQASTHKTNKHKTCVCVHRDIKPENYLIRNDPNNPICMIDFGLAAQSKDTTSTEIGRHSLGTEKYMSVRAHEGKDLVPLDDVASWYYSVAALFFRCLGKEHKDLPWSKMDGNVIKGEKEGLIPPKTPDELPPPKEQLVAFCKNMMGIVDEKGTDTSNSGITANSTLKDMQERVNKSFQNIGNMIFANLSNVPDSLAKYKYENDFELIDKIIAELDALIERWGGDEGPYCWEHGQIKGLTPDIIADISMIDLENRGLQPKYCEKDSESDGEWWNTEEKEEGEDTCSVA